MTLKNSFWVSLKENNKRRIWVWILSVLSFVLAYPAYTALRASRVLMRFDGYVEDFGLESAGQMIHEQLLKAMQNALGFGEFTVIFAVIIAVISAIQGFSYLYSKKKINFYHGLPIKRKRRFLIIWLNGILLFVIPYVVGLLISMIVATTNGGMNALIFKEAIIAFGVILLFYLSVYQLAIFAVMLTGNVVITCLGFGVFCLYEWLTREIIYSFMEKFFRYYSYNSANLTPLISPISMYFKFVNEYQTGGTIRFGYLAGLFLFTLITGVMSYVCYKKRPAEAAGKAMVFAITKPLVKIPLTVLLALTAGILIMELIGFEPAVSTIGMGYIIFAMVVAVILGSCFMQVIYDADIKAALHKKRHIVISGILTALIFMMFRYDLLGYDAYIPNPEQVESAAFIPNNYEIPAGYGNSYFDEKGNYLSEYEYAKKYMFIKDTNSVCELVKISMENSGDIDENKIYSMENHQWSMASLIYRLKDGREVSRRIWVDTKDPATIQLLDQIIGSEEFQAGAFVGVSNLLSELLADSGTYTVQASYGNTIYTNKMNKDDVTELLEAYKKDMANTNFSLMSSCVPTGSVRLEFRAKTIGTSYSYNSRSSGFNIYPFFENSIACLKENGYYIENQLNPEDVDRIQVVNYNYELSEQLQEEQKSAVGAATIGTDTEMVGDWEMAEKYGYELDARVFANYTDAEDIAEIAACIYSSECLYEDWDHGTAKNQEYEVNVYFKADSRISKEYGMNAYYGFVGDQIPAFVQEDTTYQQ